MKDEEKTREELIRELHTLRLRIATLESWSSRASAEGDRRAVEHDRNSSVHEFLDAGEEVPHLPIEEDDPRQCFDLSTLFTEGITPTGSFDLVAEKRATAFGQLLQALPIPALLIDKSCQIIVSNQACARIISDHEDLPGQFFPDLFLTPTASSRVQALVEVVFSDRKARVAHGFMKGHKGTVWGRMSLRSIRTMNKRYLLVLIEDLSQEQNLLSRNERIRTDLERQLSERTADLRELNESLLREIENRKHSEKALRTLKEELEQTVADRTAELRQRNEELHAEIVDRHKTQDALVEREAFLANIFDSFQDGLNVVDMDFNIIRVNKTMEGWYPHARPLLGKKCYEVYHGGKEPCQDCPIKQTYNTGKPACATVPFIDADRETRGWLELCSFPIFDATSGRMKGAIKYARDITDRKRAEELLEGSLKEKEVLLREIHHRVKNHLASVAGMLRLQSRRAGEESVVDMFTEAANRVTSLRLVHEKLYMSDNIASIHAEEYLQSLVDHISRHSDIVGAGITVNAEIEDVSMGPDTAVPLGMILAELLSNSLKHAFPHGRGGRVSVEFRCIGKNQYRLEVADDGVGAPERATAGQRKTLGLELVRLFSEQLEAELSFVVEQGTKVQVTFSVP